MSKQNLSLNLLSLILLMIFFVLPLSVLGNFLKYQNDIFFNIIQRGSTNFLDISILIFLTFLSLLIIAVCYYFLRLHDWIKSNLVYFLGFVCIWIFLSGFFFPTSSLTGIIDPSSAGVNKRNLIIVILSSLILPYFLCKEKISKIFVYFIYFFLFINLSISCIEIFSKNKTNKINLNENLITNENNLLRSAKLNPTNNILVISFDGISSLILEDIFLTNPKIKEVFKDFEFYNNIISQAPATTLSLAGELYGNLEYKKISSDENLLINELNALPNILKETTDYFTFGDYNTFNNDNNRKILNYINYQEKDNVIKILNNHETSLEIYRYSMSRFGTRLLVNFFDDLKFYLYKKFFKININNLDLKDKIFFHRGASFEKKTLTDIQIFKEFTEKIHVDNLPKNKISLRMFHFNFSHFPVDFDDNCNYFSYNRKLFLINQNYESVKKETLCSIKLMSNFLKKLIDLDLYENSTIVLKSDHGTPSNYFIKSKFSNINYDINNHKQFGYLRYKPFLMIKKNNETRSKIKINNNFKSLNYLNYFYCDILQKNNCKFDNIVQIYVPEKNDSSFEIKDLIKLQVKSKNEFINLILNTK